MNRLRQLSLFDSRHNYINNEEIRVLTKINYLTFPQLFSIRYKNRTITPINYRSNARILVQIKLKDLLNDKLHKVELHLLLRKLMVSGKYDYTRLSIKYS